jgi:hypothetical protein
MTRSRSQHPFHFPAALLLVVGLGIFIYPATGQARLPRVLAWESTVKGDENISLRWPVAVAHRSAQEIVVADSHEPRLVFFKDSGVAWTPKATIPLDSAPLDIAADGDRYVVSLRDNPRLLAVEGDQHQLRRLALPEGVVPGSLATLQDGGVLIHDLNSGTVFSLSPQGSVRSVAEDVGFDVGDLAATAGGGFVATFPLAGEVRRFDATGRETGRWPVPAAAPVPAWPVGITLEPSGAMIVADRHGQRLVVLDSAGRPQGVASRHGWSSGLLRHPSRLDRLPDGRVIVVDQGNGRMQLFRSIEERTGP